MTEEGHAGVGGEGTDVDVSRAILDKEAGGASELLGEEASALTEASEGRTERRAERGGGAREGQRVDDGVDSDGLGRGLRGEDAGVLGLTPSGGAAAYVVELIVSEGAEEVAHGEVARGGSDSRAARDRDGVGAGIDRRDEGIGGNAGQGAGDGGADDDACGGDAGGQRDRGAVVGGDGVRDDERVTHEESGSLTERVGVGEDVAAHDHVGAAVGGEHAAGTAALLGDRDVFRGVDRKVGEACADGVAGDSGDDHRARVVAIRKRADGETEAGAGRGKLHAAAAVGHVQVGDAFGDSGGSVAGDEETSSLHLHRAEGRETQAAVLRGREIVELEHAADVDVEDPGRGGGGGLEGLAGAGVEDGAAVDGDRSPRAVGILGGVQSQHA